MDKFVCEMKGRDFFSRCAKAGLVHDAAIASTFSMSRQTVKNWRRCPDRKLKAWVILAFEGYEAFVRAMSGPGCRLPGLPGVTVNWFRSWMERNGLRTLSDVGAILGLTKQAVHNWFARNRFPNWLALACLGVECRRKGIKATQVRRTVRSVNVVVGVW